MKGNREGANERLKEDTRQLIINSTEKKIYTHEKHRYIFTHISQRKSLKSRRENQF